MKKILIPIDGSEYAQKAMEKGKEIAQAFGSDIVLLTAIYVPLPIHAAVDGDSRGLIMIRLAEGAKQQAEDMLKAARDSFGDMADKIETVALEGDAASMIIDYAKDHDIDFIVMGSHGLGAVLHRLIVGSVTTKVLHHVDQPVLVVK